MLGFATKALLGRRRSRFSGAAGSWIAAFDGSGRQFWFNESTHEVTYADPNEHGICAAPPSPPRQDCRATAPSCPSTPSFSGYAPPQADGYMASPAFHRGMSPPAATAEYMPQSSAGCSCVPPQGFAHNQHHHQHHNQHHRQPQESDCYPVVEIRSPCSFAAERSAPQHHQNMQQHPPGHNHHHHHHHLQCDQGPRQRLGWGVQSDVPFGSTICGGGGGTRSYYRWEECYTQTSGKKFWRHKETGAILKNDPYC